MLNIIQTVRFSWSSLECSCKWLRVLDTEDQAFYPLHRQRESFGTSAVGGEGGLYTILSQLNDHNLCACTNTELASHSIPALARSLTLHFSWFLHTCLLHLKIFLKLMLSLTVSCSWRQSSIVSECLFKSEVKDMWWHILKPQYMRAVVLVEHPCRAQLFVKQRLKIFVFQIYHQNHQML